MKHQVLIEQAVFHAKHGVFPEENIIGGRFEIDLQMDTDFTQAAAQDDLNGTINYAAVYDLIQVEVDQPSKLIEHLAQRIVNQLKGSFPEIEALKLKVSKCNPPIAGEVAKVSVVIES